MEYDYDYFVIGAGSGGVRSSRMAAPMGAKTAVAEDRDVGGTCVNVGCVPKKLFVYASHFQEEARHAANYGWNVDNVDFDWDTLLTNKNGEISRLNAIYDKLLGNAGVELIKSKALVEGPNTVRCDEKVYTAKYILIATGSWPTVPEFPGSEHVITSNEAFFLGGLPEKALVVGGGYIGVEFAGILSGLGVNVTLSYRGDLFLRGFDQDLREYLRDEMIKKDMDLRFNSNITSIEKTTDGLEVSFADGSKDTFGKILYATGRHPKTKGLGLEKAGVKLSPRGAVLVDEDFRSSCPSIFAVGDVIDRVQLTPVALAEGQYVANLLFGQKPKAIDYNLIPTAIFSQPEMATVGLTEEQARKQYGDDDIQIFKGRFTSMKHRLVGSNEQTLAKMIVQKSTQKVLAVHMGGLYAAEIIQGVGVALKCGATKEHFDDTFGIHPTSAEELVTMK